MPTSIKVSQLTADASPTQDDLVYVVNDPDGTPVSRKSTVGQLFLAMKLMDFAQDAGSTDAYAATLSPAPVSYETGKHYRFKANTANTGACSVNFNGLGAKTIKKAAGGITTDLADNEIRAGQWVDLVYDGTNMQMVSPSGDAVTKTYADALVAGGAGPTGAAGGTLGGTYPNPTVNTDGSTLETNSNALRMKDAGTTLAKLANLANATVIGRNTAGTGVPEAVTMPQLWALIKTQVLVEICIAASDETTALATGTAKVTFRMPHAMTLTAVRGSLSTAQASGSIFTVDINEGGTTILSTKLTIDNTEKTSTTAATPAVISDAALGDDAEITIDVDQVGDGTAKGLKIWLIGTRA